jgi:DNA polymerase-3 subunit delta'
MPFRAIAGHAPPLALLARAVARGTLPPSLLFSGPSGIGKRLTAVALAQALNCERPIPFAPTDGSDPDPTRAIDACGSCRSCARIARGVHADVLIVEPAESGAIKLDQVRDAIERTAYRPFEGKRRLVAIDDADALNAEAQNALLKTLEEPPPASVFVLITDRPDMLLPTVRSRCQRLRFAPLSPSDVADVLVREHGMTTAEAHAAAAAADGSIGRAVDGSAEAAIEARDAAARLLHGAASSTDPRRRLDGAKALVGGAGDRDELSRRLLALSSLLRDLGLLGAHADARTLANRDLQPQLDALLRFYDGDRTLRAFAAVDRALDALGRNASPKIVADWLSLSI